MPNSFKRNILLGFGASLVLLIISSAASYISIKHLLSSSRWVDHTNQVLTGIESVGKLTVEAETNQRGFLLTGDPVFTEGLESSIILVKDKIKEIKTLITDNPEQQKNVEQLVRVSNVRINELREVAQIKKKGLPVTTEILMRGRQTMEDMKSLIDRMERAEQRLLAERTKSQQQFSTYTPLLIVIAALISLAITILFYTRIMSDFKNRSLLQEELIRKDREISQRLNIIQNIADKISAGDYKTRLDEESKDVLGVLSGSLNRMAQSLDYSFTILADKEWEQTGLAGLSERVLGEQSIETLTDNILGYLTEYTGSRIGALYLRSDSNYLSLTSRFALSESARKEIRLGEGIVGQCALNKKIVQLENLAEENFDITFAAGVVKPSSIIAIPLMFEGFLMGVVELGSLKAYNKNDIQFLQSISQQAGVAIHTSQSRRKLQDLLEETQSQSEELQAQHNELENINEELKAQSQKLQVSEEELKVQQEELMQTNQELEERTTMLEEKNQMIEERNREIQVKANELELSTRYKSEFLANMSHELRTPLNSILLLSRLMSENSEHNLSKDQVESAEVIQKSGQGLLSLIDEILDLSKIEAGKMDMDYQEIAVREITNDIQALFAPVAREKGLGFEVQIEKDVPEYIETDKMRVGQVLKNLISNALKFTAKGSVKLVVNKHTEGSLKIVFSVKDTGIGIPADKQKMVFEAFRQADGSTRRNYGGTGLGLSISRELARLLGGEIELISEQGKGSDFRLIIPVSKPVQDAESSGYFEKEKPEQDRVSQPLENPSAEPPHVLVTENDTPGKMNEVFQRIETVLKKEPKKVLIIEENHQHARALSYFLENFNIQALIKSNTEGSIKALLDSEVKCVILDAGIANAELNEALEEIKKTPGLELLPVIVFTGKSLSKTEEIRMKKNVNSIIIKTAHSYQRVLDEVSLYLHMTQELKTSAGYRKPGTLLEVLKEKKVLIADDDVRNIFSLSKALEAYGMNIISAIDGKEALQQIQNDPSIDIVLMDMMMPELDGYETMKSIREMDRFKRLPIIAVTAKAMAGDREKCIRAGASDYITKPVDKDQLLSLLRVWLYDGKK